jgi:4-oxalocrotonate tautomerase
MPFVNIRVVREVIADDPSGKKAKIAKKVTEAIVEVTGLTKDDVWVVFEEVAAKDWFVGPASVQELRKAAGK